MLASLTVGCWLSASLWTAVAIHISWLWFPLFFYMGAASLFTPVVLVWVNRDAATAGLSDREEVASALYDYFNPEGLNGDDAEMSDMRHAADAVLAVLTADETRRGR